MNKIPVFVCCSLALLIIGCGAEQPASPPSDFFLPVGNADAGRQAFQDLHCYACHQVEGDSEMPASSGDVQAPVIGSDQAGQSRDRIANSIVSPQHEVAPPRGWATEMANYRTDMKVQQLIDLVTFVSSKSE